MGHLQPPVACSPGRCSPWAEKRLCTLSELSGHKSAHCSQTSNSCSSRWNSPKVQTPPHTPPQAFNLLCHHSNYSQISCFCGSRQEWNYWFMCFISIMLFFMHLNFCFFWPLLLTKPEICNSAVPSVAHVSSKFEKLIHKTVRLMQRSNSLLQCACFCIHQHRISSATLLFIQLIGSPKSFLRS